MRSSRVFSIAFIVFAVILPSAAQQTSPTATPPQRDPQAIAVIQQSIAALGGAEVLAQVQSVIAQGSIVSAKGASGQSGDFVWEDQFAAQGHEFKATFQSASVRQDFVSGHGNPGLVSNGKILKFPSYIADANLPVHLPALILAGSLANARCNIIYMGPVNFNGQAAIQVRTQLDQDASEQPSSLQDWYFDPNSALPLRVEYQVPDTHLSFKFAMADADFSDYRLVQGLAIPFQIQMSEDGVARNIATMKTVAINAPVSTSDFDLPAGGAQ